MIEMPQEPAAALDLQARAGRAPGMLSGEQLAIDCCTHQNMHCLGFCVCAVEGHRTSPARGLTTDLCMRAPGLWSATQFFGVVMRDFIVSGGGDPGKVCCAILHGVAAMVRPSLRCIVYCSCKNVSGCGTQT